MTSRTQLLLSGVAFAVALWVASATVEGFWSPAVPTPLTAWTSLTLAACYGSAAGLGRVVVDWIGRAGPEEKARYPEGDGGRGPRTG